MPTESGGPFIPRAVGFFGIGGGATLTTGAVGSTLGMAGIAVTATTVSARPVVLCFSLFRAVSSSSSSSS